MSDYEWIDPHFAEMSEFAKDPDSGELERDDCGPCGSEVALACIEQRTPTQANMLAIRKRDIDKKWFTPGSGQTVYELVQDVQTFTRHGVTLCPTTVDFSKPNANALDDFLVKALRDRHNPCVLNVGNAQALPGNERGVRWHFVAVGGVRGVSGVVSVLISNGDEIPYLGKPLWATLDELHAAQLVAVVEYHRPTIAPPPLDTGWHDDGTTVTANGFSVTQGFRTYLLSNRWLGSPISRAWDDAGSSYQLFTYGMLVWRGSGAVFAANVGENLLKGVLPTVPDTAKQPNKA